jgi:acyl-CoA thioester hydrolase
MEEARIDWLDNIGFGFDKIEAEGVFSPVISIACNYKNPSTFKDKIEIEITISKFSEIKFEFAYIMRVGEKIVCTAQSTHCFIENNRPIILSKRLPELYKAINEAYNNQNTK